MTKLDLSRPDARPVMPEEAPDDLKDKLIEAILKAVSREDIQTHGNQVSFTVPCGKHAAIISLLNQASYYDVFDYSSSISSDGAKFTIYHPLFNGKETANEQTRSDIEEALEDTRGTQ
jgi:hypothetical protein